jgi:hypothetical protein
MTLLNKTVTNTTQIQSYKFYTDNQVYLEDMQILLLSLNRQVTKAIFI